MSKNTSTFLEGPILPSLLKFAVPVLLALFLQALYGAVDLFAVGQFAGKADVSAVATGSQTMLIVTGLITGLSMGTTILLGQKLGEKNYKSAAKVIASSILIFMVLGIIFTVLMVLLAPFVAKIMKAPIESFEKTIHYIQVCGGGTIFIVAYNLLTAIFRGMGNSKAPLFFVFIACIINIIGDILLIKVFSLGAMGAALATVLAQAVSVIFSILLILKHGFNFDFDKEDFKFDKKIGKQIIKLGSPIAFQDMFNEMSFLILIGLVNSLGVTASAGVGVAERLVMFILLIPTAYMSSISAFVAQNIGANNHERAKSSMWQGMMTAAILGGFMAYLSFFHGDLLSSIFSNDNDVITASHEFLRATAIESFVLSIAYCFIGYFNGIGKTKFVMLQGFLSITLVRIPYAFYAVSRPNPQLFQIGMSAAFTAIFTFIVCLSYYLYYTNKKIRIRV